MSRHELGRPTPSTCEFDSSVLESGEWDPISGVMTLTFVGGRTYSFEGVSEDDWVGLCMAPSAGRHFNEHVRGKFDSRRGQ